jgi:hypothetical protein
LFELKSPMIPMRVVRAISIRIAVARIAIAG